MKKILLAVALIVTLAVFIMSKKEIEVSDRPVIKFGLIAPLSGDNAEVSENVREVILNYIKENEGKNKIHYEVIVEDDGFKVRNVAPLVNKLVNVDKVSAIITAFAYVGMTTAPITKNAKVTHINIGSNTDLADGQYNFLNYTPPVQSGMKMLELMKIKNVKSFALVHMDHVGPAPYVNEIKKQATQSGLKFYDYAYNQNERDFRMMLNEIEMNKPDMVVLLALPPSVDVFRKQMIDLEVNIPVSSINFVSTSNNKELFEGVEFVESPDGNDEFVKKVHKLGIDNMFLLAFSEDSIRILINICEEYYAKNGTLPSKEDVAIGFRNVKNFEGAAGTYSIGADGITNSKAIFKKIKNGKVVSVGDEL